MTSGLLLLMVQRRQELFHDTFLGLMCNADDQIITE